LNCNQFLIEKISGHTVTDLVSWQVADLEENKLGQSPKIT
jgi:hypothetical protein